MNQSSVLIAVLLCVGCAHEPTTLRVALYPYVPDGDALFFELEEAFEAAHPGVNLEAVRTYTDSTGQTQSLGAYYYSGPKADPVPGLLRAEADVLEVDTVLLGAMVDAGRLQPLAAPEAPDWLDVDDWIPGSVEATTTGGTQWAVPHWVCGNFVVYSKDNAAIREASDWSALVSAASGGLLLDLKGTSTLGEWYLLALAPNDGALAALDTPSPAPRAVEALATLLGGCPPGYCRSDEFHDKPGLYGRLFARKVAEAYVGYSESLHATLSELMQSCAGTGGCVEVSEVAIRALPPARGRAAPVGWVDGLGIRAGIAPIQRELAQKFIAFAVSWEAYESVLTPPWGHAPRYLLPARSGWDRLEPALYPALEEAFGDRQFYSHGHSALRDKGGQLDKLLPQNDRPVPAAKSR